MPTLQLSQILGSSLGPFKMTVTATGVPRCVVEATTDFSGWTPLLTNTASPYEFWDLAAPGRPSRFYRARSSP